MEKHEHNFENDAPVLNFMSFNELESVCGENDLMPVEKYDGSLGVPKAFVEAHQRPVGLLRKNGRGICSGTLISDNLFLTAGHCIELGVEGVEAVFNFQTDPNGELRESEAFRVIKVLEVEYKEEQRDENLGIDYAILQLEGNPGTKYGFTRIANADPREHDMLCIIQHPEGTPKMIEAGPVSGLKGNYIHYNSLDTLKGASGSGILFYPSGKIVGVHTNGGCTPSEEGANRGTRISFLLEISPILNEIASST